MIAFLVAGVPLFWFALLSNSQAGYRNFRYGVTLFVGIGASVAALLVLYALRNIVPMGYEFGSMFTHLIIHQHGLYPLSALGFWYLLQRLNLDRGERPERNLSFSFFTGYYLLLGMLDIMRIQSELGSFELLMLPLLRLAQITLSAVAVCLLASPRTSSGAVVKALALIVAATLGSLFISVVYTFQYYLIAWVLAVVLTASGVFWMFVRDPDLRD
ncbi:MAG: hypothetical protein K9L68_03020 [Spirochaetales bacterium]|nr:hypothetical protein [Spirochaetales bacterium]MCF7937548.1 hypothetical protein [Spirochaetales bacterium]